MPAARLATPADLDALLALFAVAEVSRAVEPRARAEQIWQETLARDGLAVFVSEADAKIVSTCMLITVPNLLRGGRQNGFIDTVVTHPDFQARGHGRAVIAAALAEAWQRDLSPDFAPPTSRGVLPIRPPKAQCARSRSRQTPSTGVKCSSGRQDAIRW
jgi:ribosomal protein S18 acetylase RimI-like enzyme